MPGLILRYKHLVERGIVYSRPRLKNLIDNSGFPPGRMMSPNTRAWTEEEIDKWWKSRANAKAPPLKKGICKTKTNSCGLCDAVRK